MIVAPIVLVLFLVAAFALGLLSRRGKDMDLEQWSVGGRGFGSVLVFLLLAGEIYTTFTFLGASGYAYSYGGASYYILCYGALAYVMSYWLAPAIWRYAARERLVSQPDWFVRKYRSRGLGLLVSIIGVVAMVPYLQLQLTGLGIIVEETSYGALSSTAAIWIGAIVLAAYVIVAGIHSAAWNAVLKDILVLVVVVAIGIYIPVHFFGGLGTMFDTVETAKPGFLALADASHDTGWFLTSVLLSALGFFMWPHYFGAVYAAKDEQTFRRNAMFLPLYQLILLFVIFVGLTASVAVPGLAQGDLSLLRVARESLPPVVVGLVGAAGLFCALVPGAMLLTTSATMLAQNVYREFVRPSATDAEVGRLAKILVPVVTAIVLYLTFQGGSAIVNLLLLGYAFVTQLLPAVLASLLRRNPVTRWGAGAGMVVGVVVVTWLTLGKINTGQLLPFLPAALGHLNVGVVALVVNILVTAAVSALTRSETRSDRPAGDDDVPAAVTARPAPAAGEDTP
ncbi:sodium:solute symporter family protein [Pseudonocardia phyllosphaerae]|uniref:sodium:solute symporter family protein n=1 Tax=Pseudonocardia phyllosphaerae TaxID=3390502 RepID=UPI00397DEAC9